jgi:hypothetical protein
MPLAKHQLCYWHGIKYLQERLAEDKPPAKYDPRTAHAVFDLIDPTWAPGVTSGWVEEGIHHDDVENPKNDENECDQENGEDPPPSTCRPPGFVLVSGDTRVPVWPNPPKYTKASLPVFCPKELRGIIVEKFRIHLHQHPEIPFNDKDHTRFTADEIHRGAVKDMYDFCYQHDLSQVWAYLWNRWYTPKQWKLWARSADDAIPRLKTTMVVESLWRNIKHRDLAEYNRPRLDLVTHTVVTNTLPRIKRTLAYVLGSRRVGRAKALASWQEDFKAEWLQLTKCDERRLVEKELHWRKLPAKTKGRTERLAQIEEEKDRPHGKYLTEIDRWTCSCPAYLISRFLMCKHLVREANEILDDAPLTRMEFFAKLSRQHYPPYYSIEGIHFKDDAEDSGGDIEVRILGTKDVENIRIASSTRSSSPPRVEDEEMEEMDEMATTSDAEEDPGADKEDSELEGAETVERVSNNQG